MTEQQLIEGCKKNDRKAQKFLYNKYASILLGLCIRYVHEKSEAEDILQDGFVKILQNIGDFNATGSFEGWMKRIVINTAITHYHKNLKHYHHYEITEVRESKIPDQTNENYDNAEFTRDELIGVIAELPPGYKMVFNLFAIEGYKHKDIAELLKIDVNTSKSQFSRARKLVQKKLEELQKIKQSINQEIV